MFSCTPYVWLGSKKTLQTALAADGKQLSKLLGSGTRPRPCVGVFDDPGRPRKPHENHEKHGKNYEKRGDFDGFRRFLGRPEPVHHCDDQHRHHEADAKQANHDPGLANSVARLKQLILLSMFMDCPAS